MKSFLIRWLVTAIAVFAAVEVIPGIECNNSTTLIAASLILGIFNAILKPILLLFSLPLVLLTLGLFIPVINALLLWLTSALVPEFHVSGFWSALFGGIDISIVTFVLNAFARTEGRTHIIYRESGLHAGKREEKVIDI